jgi:hypothetical protein
MVALPGVIAIDVSSAGATVSVVAPLTLPSVALMAVVPVPTPVARPDALIVATDVVAEAHVTWLVKFSVVLSENVPVAVNCCVKPLATLGSAGVTAIDSRIAALTVNVVEPVMLSSVALIVEVPVATPVAIPAAVIVATEVVADAHVTWLVRFSVELSENVPVAVNAFVSPLATLGSDGVTAIDSRIAALTVNVVEPVTPSSVALIVDVPVATPVATPAVVIVATDVVADAHVTWLVRFSVELSE